MYTNCNCGTWIDIFLSWKIGWRLQTGWCISVCYQLHIQDALSILALWDRRLGRPGFSACSCKMLTPSWLPYPLLERSFFTCFFSPLPVWCIKSKWTTLPTLMNKLALLLNHSSISNETQMQVRFQQSSSFPWILHLFSAYSFTVFKIFTF